MSMKIYWNTVSPLLKATLQQLMYCEALSEFRLVGGTSLSLQLGHRMSIDIDMFTDSRYDSINFAHIDESLRTMFAYVHTFGSGQVSMGKRYEVGNTKDDTIKLDLYYTDEYIQPALIVEDIRFATVEEIIAMKLDIVQRVARKKDFWDLDELMDNYQLDEMLRLHQLRYPYDHDENLIRTNFTNFTKADEEADPMCLRGKHWEIIKTDIVKAVS